MAFVFYDTETTGLETAFDQILQFGAIRTDDDLNEVERINVRCRLLPHVVPSPGALLATGIRPATLVDPSLPSHYEAIQQIRAKLLEWSPAIIIGYNSLDFDENFLRQALFQTLHPTYLTNTNGNVRGDVMRMVMATAIYAPNAISVPINDRGRDIFKLDQLAPANGFAHDHAHDAIADVEATIHMARLVRDRAPEIWDTMMGATRKQDVSELIMSEPMFAHTAVYHASPYTYLVTCCGQNPQDNGQLAVFDLAFDPEPYLDNSVEELVGVLEGSPKPIRSIRANAQPILMSSEHLPDSAKAAGVDGAERQRRVEVIQGNPGFRERVGEALAARYADEPPSPHVEKRIYDGFPSSSDQALLQQIHEMPWEDRAAVVDQLEDDRLKEFGTRLIYFDQPEALPEAKRAELDDWRARRVLGEGEDVPWMTIPKAIQEVDKSSASAVGEKAERLSEMREFFEELADQFGP